MRNKLLFSALLSSSVCIVLIFLLSINAFQSINLGLSDRLYSEQRPFSEISVIAIDDKSLNEIGRWPWNRDVFANALEKLNDSAVIGIDISFFEKSGNDAKLSAAIEKMKDKIVLVSECSFENGKCTWTEPIFKAETGYANILVEKGTARKVPMVLDEKKAFSKVIAEKYGVAETRQSIMPRFSRYPKISFSDVLNNSYDFKGKIALIGVTAKDLHDETPTPIGVLPGIEIHASAIQTMILGNSLDYQDRFGIILAIIILSAIVMLALYRFKPAIASILAFMLIVVYFIICILEYDNGLVMNIFYPILSIILTYLSIILLYYALESNQRKFIANMLGKYVSPSVADELIRKGKDALHLKGEKKIITVLFADVRGFTSFSEKNSAETVVSLLNLYHGKMTDIIFKHNGTLDKYVGDEIMATYNVPLDIPDHALAAVKTAIEMQKASKEIGKGMSYGIGINTGHAIVGNIGSEKRLDYTVIGDSVNLGARLCSKAEANQIIISDATYNLVKDKIHAKSLGEIQVKGKEHPIKVYEVLGLK